MALKAVDAAFEGFRLIGREPRTVLAWCTASVLVGALSLGAMIAMGLPKALSTVSAVQPGGNPFAVFQALGGVLAAGLLIGLITYSVGICAVYRAILRPEETGWARLRLGADEGRMLLLMLILWLIGIAAYIVVVIAVVIVAGIVGVAVFGGGANHLQAGGLGGAMLLMAVLYLGIFAFFAWFGVQFSMAAPMTFAKREIHVFRSWKVVRGNFWGLLGCFFLNLVVVVVLYFILAGIQAGLQMAVGAPSALQALTHPGVTPNMADAFTPAALAVTLISSFVGAAFYPLYFAPAAAAYRDIVGPESGRQADVFA